MNKVRKLAIWLTGRDLLESTTPMLQIGSIVIYTPPEPRWELRFAKGANFVVVQSVGPNVLHRAIQKVVLGVSWHMLTPAPTKPAPSKPAKVASEVMYEET